MLKLDVLRAATPPVTFPQPTHPPGEGTDPDTARAIRTAGEWTDIVLAAGIDLTADYGTWTILGRALVPYGEAGEAIFQRISSLYPGYTQAETSKKFAQLRASANGSVRVGTFVYYCRQAVFQKLQELVQSNRGTAAPAPAPGPITAPTTDPGPDPATAHLRRLLATEEALRAQIAVGIQPPPVLFRQYGEAVMHHRTLALLQGQTGAFKSRMAELFASVLLAGGRPPAVDSLGLTFHPAPGVAYRVVYVDTERDLTYQLPDAMGRIGRQADRSVPAADFRFTSLKGIERSLRLGAIRQYLREVRRGFDGHLVVIIDVLSDVCESFNDERIALCLLDQLGQLVDEEGATVLCLLHENPGGGPQKARGHMGTEGTNKASTVLHVGFAKRGEDGDAEVVELKYLKRRHGRRGLTVYARYDEAAQCLVRADEASVRRLKAGPRGRESKAPLRQFQQVLPELLQKPAPAGALVAQLAERFATSDRTVRDRLRALLAGVVFPDGAGGFCTLKRGQDGKNATFWLSPVLNRAEDAAEPPPQRVAA